MRCKSKTKASGDPCRAQAISDSDYCYMHTPGVSVERARARRRGGQHRRVPHGDLAAPGQVRNLQNVLELLDYTLSEILVHENSLVRGRLLVAIAEGFTKAIQVGEFETRLQELEKAVFSGEKFRSLG